jgi:spore coat protein U-like protein
MNTYFPSRLLGIATAAACMTGVVGMAQAATATATMPVSATVPVSCTAAAGTSMAFGNLTTTLALAVSQADTTGTLTVTCTNGASYSIVAGDGNNYSSGWRMANGSSQYVTYSLYSDSGRSTAFPRSGTTLGGTGTGAAQTVTAYGRIPAQTAGGSGSFTDSVTFTVTY